MYTRTLHINLIDFPKEDISLLESVDSQSSFKHEFTNSKTPDDNLIAESDAVFIYADAQNAKTLVDKVAKSKTANAQIILISTAEGFDALGHSAEDLTDFWAKPLTSSQLLFHFKHWQKSIECQTDLWETRQFLDATIDSIPSLVWYKTQDGIHEKVNASFCKTVGKTKDQVQGQRHAYIWDVEEDDPACIDSENLVMSSKKTCVSEEVVQSGDDTRLLTTYKSPLYDYDGSVMGTVGVGIDVTQERAYETELLEKSNSLETIFTALDAGVLSHSLDGTRILGVNQKALDILGYESEEELREKGFDMIAASVIEEDAERLKDEIRHLTEVGDSISTEYGVRHEDGELLHILGNIKVIEKDGEKYYHRFLLDVTDQRAREEEKARKSRDLIQALSEDYLVVCSFDLDTGIGEALRVTNDDIELVEIFSGNLLLQDTVATYLDVRVHDEDQQMMEDTLSAEGIKEELELKKRFDRLYRTQQDGQTRFRQVSIVRSGNWADSKSVVVGFRNVDQQIRDELEQKTLLEEALGNANKASNAKSAFLLNMSHDIRTPMNAIVGFTNLASNHLNDSDKVEGYLDKIKASSDHLLNLINDILDMSRIEQGKLTLDENQCNIKEVLDDLYVMLNHQAESKGLTLTVDSSAVTHPNIVCDRLKVNQILLNLLGNSIKFTNAGGSVSASIEELPSKSDDFGTYRIVVEDTGIGMPEEFLDVIFDPFERVQSQTVNGIQGSGLGMAIVKSLVDMMGGTIKVESELDKGTRFTVNLTFKIAESDSVEQTESHNDSPTFTPERASKFRILLVDDNPLNREIAQDILMNIGFNVEEAENGQEAVDKLRNVGAGHFDIVLMDIQMPVMNGYQAAEIIRSFEDADLAGIPILAVTADAFEEDRKMALEHGMNGHLPKPIDISKLFSILDTILGS